MSTPTDRAAKAITDLVGRVGVEDATAKMVQLAKEMAADEAQDLARRWTAMEGLAPGFGNLLGWERERLFTWVREREDVFAAPGGYRRLATELGITADEAAALCEGVWP